MIIYCGMLKSILAAGFGAFVPTEVDKRQKRKSADENDEQVEKIPTVGQVEQDDQSVPMNTDLIRMAIRGCGTEQGNGVNFQHRQQ